MGVFNNRNSAQCNSYNIGYNQSFQNCSNFILVSVIFICLVYLFTLMVYMKSSLSYIVRIKSRTICGYLHILLHISLKLSLPRAYLSTHKFDFICISETYFNSDTSTVNENLEIAGYTLIRADHPSNTK